MADMRRDDEHSLKVEITQLCRENDEAWAEVERLRMALAGQERLDTRLIEAQAEVEQLRDALRQIAESDWTPPFIALHAREALEGKPWPPMSRDQERAS